MEESEEGSRERQRGKRRDSVSPRATELRKLQRKEGVNSDNRWPVFLHPSYPLAVLFLFVFLIYKATLPRESSILSEQKRKDNKH